MLQGVIWHIWQDYNHSKIVYWSWEIILLNYKFLSALAETPFQDYTVSKCMLCIHECSASNMQFSQLQEGQETA